ncbi:hypothetical protein G4Y79_20560 [Phototrophicus methaneseepsis]|uniref:Uncharacterized protein n=1 Tax=Phototrophicus methaneseepsis TaxID=2710758 RepID=A0A7S8E826_9CHLR|nr:hypothetical protein [Phototrophicus methaneseepsis]QPC82052.1 hypothetical protein G4Y79_20560 [Phototrophicus methaneseepsis]
MEHRKMPHSLRIVLSLLILIVSGRDTFANDPRTSYIYLYVSDTTGETFTLNFLDTVSLTLEHQIQLAKPISFGITAFLSPDGKWVAFLPATPSETIENIILYDILNNETRSVPAHISANFLFDSATRVWGPSPTVLWSPDSNDPTFVFVSKGTILGTTNRRLPYTINHLHLEIFVRGVSYQSTLPYSYFDGVGSIRINPLLMFEATLAEQHINLLGDDNSFPYYPYYRNNNGQQVNLSEDPSFRRFGQIGLGVDDIDATTVRGDLSVTGPAFWDIQTPEPPGIIEWPLNTIGQTPVKTLLSTVGTENLSLITYLERFYPSGSNYYTDSEESLNCVGEGIVVNMQTTPSTITNVTCN